MTKAGRLLDDCKDPRHFPLCNRALDGGEAQKRALHAAALGNSQVQGIWQIRDWSRKNKEDGEMNHYDLQQRIRVVDYAGYSKVLEKEQMSDTGKVQGSAAPMTCCRNNQPLTNEPNKTWIFTFFQQIR